MFGQLLVSGISQGAIYALVALSLTIVFRATKIVNFGQGELFMLASFGIYIGVALLKLPYVAIIPVTIVALFLVGAGIERGLIRPMASGPHLSVTMMTIAIGYVLRGAIRYVWGRDILPMPALFNFEPMQVGSLVITADDVGITLAVGVLLVCFFVVFYRTNSGRLIQAVYQSERGARLIGVNVAAFHRTMWGVGAAMAAIAGILVAPVTLLYPDMGANALIRGFAAMTLGGFGSLSGAVTGGLLLGLVEQIAGAYVSSTLIDIAGYLIIVGVLLIRPNGLFGHERFVRV